jgi:hypothetical protein
MTALPSNSPASYPPVAAGLPTGRAGLGPHSRLIDRGAIGGLIDGRSREGRFLRAYDTMLMEHVGRNPSVVQRALITIAVRCCPKCRRWPR